jgi:hypothetical protein
MIACHFDLADDANDRGILKEKNRKTKPGVRPA